ncbi:hypothetical protein B0O99DRAFT_645055 [Bisporella sp. PMI_857]|nr:hypothetical protein B0O99DRAFT_645055 [Bisporella sp. PMI_857]
MHPAYRLEPSSDLTSPGPNRKTLKLRYNSVHRCRTETEESGKLVGNASTGSLGSEMPQSMIFKLHFSVFAL